MPERTVADCETPSTTPVRIDPTASVDDEGGHTAVSDHDAVERADREREHEHDEHGEDRAADRPISEPLGRQVASEGRHCGEAEVEEALDQGHRESERDDAEDRHLVEDVEEVLAGREDLGPQRPKTTMHATRLAMVP